MSCKCKNIIENFQGGSIPLLTTIGSQSACTSATTTVLIVSGKTNFGCDINVLNGGGIFSGGTNILDLFSSGSGSNYFTTGGTYNTGSGVLSLFLNDGNNFNVSGFTTSSGGFTASTMTLNNVPAFADDGAAATGGLSVGDVYQTSGAGAAPLNAVGILMIKQ